MRITNLTSLKSVAIDWAARKGETSIEENIDAMVEFAEARIERELRLDSQIRSLTYSAPLDQSTGEPIAQSHIVLPDDYNALSKIKTKGGVSWLWRPGDELERSGTPPADNSCVLYTILGCELSFIPAQSSDITVRYYRKYPRLADAANNTHAQLKLYPDLYLYATLTQLIIFDRAYEEAPIWEGEYKRIIAEIEFQNLNARYPVDQPLRSSVGLRGRVQQ